MRSDPLDHRDHLTALHLVGAGTRQVRDGYETDRDLVAREPLTGPPCEVERRQVAAIGKSGAEADRDKLTIRFGYPEAADAKARHVACRPAL